VRPGKRLGQVVLAPQLGYILLPRGTGAVTTGMLDAVVVATALALREALADPYQGAVNPHRTVCRYAAGEQLWMHYLGNDFQTLY
jgi:hypothetical protein